MSENLTVKNTNFAAFLQISNSAAGLAMPFAREIFILDCQIAGTGFRPAIAEIAPT